MRASTLWCVLLRHGETEAAISCLLLLYACVGKLLTSSSGCKSHPQTPPFSVGAEGSLQTHCAHILVPAKEFGWRCWYALPYKRTMNASL